MDPVKRDSRLFVEISGVFLDSYGVSWTRRDTAHAADTVLHVSNFHLITRVFVNSPGTYTHTRLTIGASLVVDCDFVQTSRLSLGDCIEAYKNSAA